ncbi:ArsR/SmtB family transcription factor [Radiobacillus deserti]|uniref:Winged helix-turn-helix transcriptional regulator n=1 Tax=Radiobacillus deserti TaxID=2594883 RepID=A0A516KK39_9BACI|nr:metalloregulator ArsR/SmtB family transcription factor [Radiobacillus deserti]QDP41759.1 winged helix-turn-helix transcriptional regulator [Radiobacillus deserti]
MLDNIDNDLLLKKKESFYNVLQDCTEIFKALADPVRQDILLMFMVFKRLNVTQIVEQSPMSRPTISHHLKIMKMAGILDSRKEATEVYYWLTAGESIEKFKKIIAAIEEIDNHPDKENVSI